MAAAQTLFAAIMALHCYTGGHIAQGIAQEGAHHVVMRVGRFSAHDARLEHLRPRDVSAALQHTSFSMNLPGGAQSTCHCVVPLPCALTQQVLRNQRIENRRRRARS